MAWTRGQSRPHHDEPYDAVSFQYWPSAVLQRDPNRFAKMRSCWGQPDRCAFLNLQWTRRNGLSVFAMDKTIETESWASALFPILKMAFETGSSVPTGDAAILPIAADDAGPRSTYGIRVDHAPQENAAAALRTWRMKWGFSETGEHRDINWIFAQSQSTDPKLRAHNEDSFFPSWGFSREFP